MDFEISGRSRANALGGLIISQSGVKRIAVTAAVAGTEVLRNFNSFDSNATDGTGTTERIWRMDREALLKLLYLKVSLMDQVLLQQ
jgi:hypothetical protein